MAEFIHSVYEDLMRGTCIANCSGHGDCLNGTCFCEIKFAGSECDGVNFPYHFGLAFMYSVVAFVSFLQLTASIFMSCKEVDKVNRCREAFKPTTPKAIYAIVFVAATIRAAYFAFSTTLASDWLLSLLSAYYPLLLTGSSLIVCFWAEVFHLRNVCFESHRFLSKSYLGFVAFNVITYSLVIAQWLLVVANANEQEKGYYLNVFNGCYAVLLFIVFVFFLIYGVEVFFKIRGGFLFFNQSNNSDSDSNDKTDDFGLMDNDKTMNRLTQPVNMSQLHQSRLGLVSQALMLLITIMFILSDILKEFWRSKVAVEGRNFHDILFRLVEIGVGLWFPCVLWNVHRPDRLWILNPKNLLRPKSPTPSTSSTEVSRDESISLSETLGCYFCYDPDRTDAGLLIQPCECKGEMGKVHHECLRKWLLQRAERDEIAKCSVCKTPYRLERDSPFTWSAFSGVSASHWLRFSLMISAISGIFMSAWALCHVLPSSPYRILVVGLAMMGIYVILKFLGQNTFSAYKQVKVSSVKIISRLPEPCTSPDTKI